MNQRRVRVLPRSESRRGEYAAKPRQREKTGIGEVISFLKVYIALTAPERTDSQSMLQGYFQLGEPQHEKKRTD